MEDISFDDNYIRKSIDIFLSEYQEKEKETYWNKKSQEFHLFWNDKIKNTDYKILKQSDLDDLVKIIDSKARGHKSEDEAIARTGIYQGLWERAIKDLKTNTELQNAFDKIINCEALIDLPRLIDNFFRINKDNNNGLSGQGANMINAFLFLKNPNIFLSVLSLKHRDLIINKLGLGNIANYKSIGEQIVKTNFDILNSFNEKYETSLTPRALSEFLYTPFGAYDIQIKNIWYEGSSFKYKVKNKDGKNIKVKMSELLLQQFFANQDKQAKIASSNNHKNIKEQQEDNNRIGKKGEELVKELEIERLIKEGYPELSSKVTIVSDNYSLGYDVLSCNNDGSERYIEVKSTTSGLNHGQFYISANELKKSKELDNYYIYFVFKIDKNPEVRFLEYPDLEDDKYFKLIPQNYLVKYKRNK